jgi:hypothetical protein
VIAVVTQEESACIKVAACVCGKDGIISSEEEAEMLKILSEFIPDFTEKDLDTTLNEFFDSEDQIEDYMSAIQGRDLIKFALYLAHKSASSDGLDPLENIALQKARSFWSIEEHE